MGVGGVMLVLAFAFAGHYMGQNAVAHNADPADMLDSLSAPASNMLAKGSLVPQSTSLEVINKTTFTSLEQVVVIDGKGDKPVVVKYGINHIAALVEKKKAQLVVIAHDVDPIEVSVPPLTALSLLPVLSQTPSFGYINAQKPQPCLRRSG